MIDEAIEICRSCIQCLHYNITRKCYYPLTTISASNPFDHIVIDLAGPFTTSTDKQHWLLVMIDIHSGFVLLRTLTDKSSAEVAQSLLKIFFDFGFPKIIQSDNGTEFVNQIIKYITKNANIDHRLITPYHPQANGSAERTVQTAKRLIFKLIKSIKEEWSLFVPFAQYCINQKISKRTKSTPFSLMFGRSANLLKNYNNIKSSQVNEEKMYEHFIYMQQILFPAIHEATLKVNQAIKERFDKKHKLINIPEGTYIMISDKTRKSKSDPANEGPFKVIKRTKGGSYELEDLDSTIMSRRYAPNELLPISNNNIFDEALYEIDRIISHRKTKDGEIEYKVRWKNYTADYDSWEPFENFDSITPIDNYWNQLKTKSTNNKDLGGSDVVHTT